MNEKDPPVRKKFTIAHELGHLYLHLSDEDGNYADNDVTLYRNGLGVLQESACSKEREANQFAAALLMPREKIEEEWLFSARVDDMARFFGVSSQAMRIRCHHLGLRE